MPIRRALLPLYGPDWDSLSHRIRFDRAQGRCEACGRPHGALVITLANGGWIDPATGEAALSGHCRDIVFTGSTRVVLSTAHVDHDPTNRREHNLRAWCQRCHLLHDAPHHFAQRRITLRSRWALADLFDGPYSLAGYPRNAP
jgi:hypothetical protein